jgi:hypothetical protein
MSLLRSKITMAAAALAVAASMAARPATAGDDGTAAWGSVGGWRIRVDRSIGNGCFALQGYRDGSVLRLGFDMTRKAIYLVLGNASWRSIELGKLYRIDFVFDGATRYSGDFRGVRLGGSTFLAGTSLSFDFTRDFMERNEVRIYYRGAMVGDLSLRNTYAAVAEVVHCQQEIAASGSGGGRPSGTYRNTAGPFAGASGAVRDPFAR